MPRYFFDMVTGGVHHPDKKGVELEDDETARDVALGTLADIARLDVREGEDTSISILVRRGNGSIYRATTTLTAEWLSLYS